MIYTELKQGLQQLLQEDISNRTSLQEMRRNIFLKTENAQKETKELEEKEQQISKLNSSIEHKRSVLQSKDERILELEGLLHDEKMTFAAYDKLQEEKVQSLNNKITELNNKLQADSALWEEVNKLTIENNNFSSKIRELILHIDTQNEKESGLQKDLTFKNSQIKTLSAEKDRLLQEIEKYTQQDIFSAGEQEKLAGEVQHIQQKVILLELQLNEAKLLVQSQNLSLANSESTLSKLKADYNEAFENIHAEKIKIVDDNAILIAEKAMWEFEKENLEEELQELQQGLELVKKVSEESGIETNYLLGRFEQEKADLFLEKQNLEQNVLSLKNSLEEEISSNTKIIESIKIENTNLLSEIQNLNTRLLEAASLSSEKISKTEDEEFIDKLFKQMDAVSDEKMRLQTEKEEVEEEVGQMQQKVSELIQTIENQQGEIKNLEETNKQIKLAQTLVFSSKDKTATKLKINELVREIDKCIALLSV